jgi:hypothetical protein
MKSRAHSAIAASAAATVGLTMWLWNVTFVTSACRL